MMNMTTGNILMLKSPTVDEANSDSFCQFSKGSILHPENSNLLICSNLQPMCILTANDLGFVFRMHF